MFLKATAAKILALKTVKKIESWSQNPEKTQKKVFDKLIKSASKTAFGKVHNFKKIQTYSDFAAQVPIRDYEALKPFVVRVVAGEPNVLWPGKPLYFAKTSGTTSGAKFIPLTKESLPNHIQSARNALLCYIHDTGNKDIVDGKMIFLQGSPILKEQHGINIGRLSGIVAHYVPKYLQKNRLPSWNTNCIDDWEEKVEAIVTETQNEDMRLISGIPSWVQMYFERLQARTQKPIGTLFKNFSLFVYGGVNFEPYRHNFEKLIGRKVDTLELFPASEGFFAFQDKQDDKGLLLQLNSGMFFEFVPADKFYDENPPRLTIGEVVCNVNYVLLVSSNAGLWAYNVGDTIKFTSLKPAKVIVTGRIAHFISAFGEHVIAKEVEEALEEALKLHNFSIKEFTVAPQLNPENGELPHHEWLMEFEEAPSNNLRDAIRLTLDKHMQNQNIYYFDLIKGQILQPLKITVLKPHTFKQYMKQQGKLGGQNKIPRLSNNRDIAEALLKIHAK